MQKFYIPALALVIGAIGGFYICRTYTPRIEEKQTVVEKEVVRKDIVTVVKEITRPDGSKEIETVTTDKSQETSNKKETKQSSTVKVSDWRVGVTTYVLSPKTEAKYNLQLDRRLLGNLGVRVGLDDKLNVNVGLFYEF